MKCCPVISTFHSGSTSGSSVLLGLLIVIASATPEKHNQNLRAVLQRLAENGLTIYVRKCEFGATSLDFLGHHLSITGMKPLEDNVSVIRSFLKPTTQRNIRQFLGLVNDY